jgi:S1-C subfamily serine protease
MIMRANVAGFLRAARLAATAVLGLLATGPARADENLYERALPATVWVLSPQPGSISMGTGVLIDDRSGMVLTSYHVVERRPAVVAFFPERGPDGQVVTDPDDYVTQAEALGIAGRVVIADATRDLALIQLERVPAGARALPIATRPARPGQEVFSIGNSGAGDGVLWRYRDGKVRQNYRRTMYYASQQKVEARVLEMTVPTNSGDSGGPILDGDGALVGITAAVDDHENAVDYGIDLTEIQALLTTALVGDNAPQAPTGTEPALVDRGETVANDDAARVVSAEIEHGVVRDGQVGLVAHLEVSLDTTTVRHGEVSLIVCDEQHEPIRSARPEPGILGGLLGVSTPITSDDFRAGVTEVELFLSYAAIDAATPPGPGRFALAIDIRDIDDGRWLLSEPTWRTIVRSEPGTAPGTPD